MRILRRIAFTAAAAAALAATGVARAETAAPAAQSVVGVCVRWGDDAHHLADAVVVDSSGNALLDEAIPRTLRSMAWDKPDGYNGAWLGLSIGVDGAKPSDKLPDCGALGDASSEAVAVPLKSPHARRI
jgi:hypothetical protein